MAWAEPIHSKKQILKAGQVLVNAEANDEARAEALKVVNNWRSAHAFPLNTLQVNLRKRALEVDADALVAQRIKRLPSIVGKLERFPSMNLARMQDLGGCRAVVSSADDVDALVSKFLSGKHKHTLVRHDDYISRPKESGYRGVHLVYGYKSDKKQTYNGLNIEIQIRSSLQHAWATAVETVGLFTRQALKSSHGEKHWLRFFRVVSAEIARLEERPLGEGDLADPGTVNAELAGLAAKLNVIERLEHFTTMLRYTENQTAGARFVLMVLDVDAGELEIKGYKYQQVATHAYDDAEATHRGNPNIDVVLVSVSSISGLRTAYPNYFLDTTRFVGILKSALS